MVATKMIWLSGISHRLAPAFFRRTDENDISHDISPTCKQSKKQKPQVFGILAFEAAKAMSRLVSLYRSLSDEEISKLSSYVVKSEGVRYLNSVDASSLFQLAYEEKIEDLDRLALVIARLGERCQHPGLQGFEHVYSDMKRGYVDFPRLGFSLNKLGRKIAKMEKMISATAEMYSALELLTEMEVSDRKLQSWKSFSGPIAVQKPDIELFEQKFSSQRSLVRRMRETSLWTKSLDEVVGLMVRVVCNVFVRICVVFSPHVSGLPRLGEDGNFLLMKSQQLQAMPRLLPSPFYASGPLARREPEPDVVIVRNSGPIYNAKTPRSKMKRDLAFYLGFGYSFEEPETVSTKSGGIARNPRIPDREETTLGAAALAMRYANVIVMAEKMLTSPEPVDEESREELYQMLPANLRAQVWEKMRRGGCRSRGMGGGSDELLASGWREGVERIVGWLAPVAHDTIRWQTERNMERQEFGVGPTVLRLQTLYYADREKTEAAIAEVLVGLSCILHYEHRRERADKRS